MNSEQKNRVLERMISLLESHQETIIQANREDVERYTRGDQAMLDRLKIDEKKVQGMILSLRTVANKPDPVGIERYHFSHPQGMEISDRTAPFGSVLIIYESRPDVTIEAACIAFKAGNKILLKGGKEALHSNLKLVAFWQEALQAEGLNPNWIQYLNYSREETQAFLKAPTQRIDLIVPRGGETLISFVKEHAKVPVLVSGRGNNFVYVHPDADWTKALPIILNAKTQKISACNALDKVLIHHGMPNLTERLTELIEALQKAQVQIWVDRKVDALTPSLRTQLTPDDAIWSEEFLAMKIVIGVLEDLPRAIDFINQHAGGHSVSILTETPSVAQTFMEQIDAAAVYHNASTRFTDGGEFGLGAELAISTDKLHHRGPLGLEHLVTNKWYVFGEGQVRN